MTVSVVPNAGRSQYVKTDNGLKGWTSFNTWEQSKQINNLLRKKLRGDGSQRMLVVIQCRMLCLPVSYSNLRHTDL